MKIEALKQLTVREFDRAAGYFDNDNPGVYNMCRKDYPDILTEIKKEEFQTVLDAGCGTGTIIYLLHKEFPKKEYYGLDLSEKMIDAAKKKNSGCGKFVWGDCEELPFANDFFDVIVCSMSFHHYTNPDKFFRNVYRVLKPNGRLILRDMTSENVFLLWFMNKIELPVVNRIFKKGDFHVYSKKEIQRLCENSLLTLEKFEYKKGFRLHACIRKSK